MPKYVVRRYSANGHVSHHVKTFTDYTKAFEYCDAQDWEYTDLTGSVWFLEIEEGYKI